MSGQASPGCLIEKHNSGVLQHSPGDSNALLLPTRHLHSPLPNLRVVLIGKPLGEPGNAEKQYISGNGPMNPGGTFLELS